MAVPYIFGTATASIPLSNLDSNFATTITLGNTAIQLGNTVTTLNNMTLANVTISGGTSSITSNSISNGTSNVSIATSGGAVTVATNGNTAVTVDTSQNVGIGMTPTNFGNGYTVLQVANATNGGMLYLTNTANAGGRIYGNGAGLTYDAFSTTVHAFNTDGTERMRIDSSGNVLVGTTSQFTGYTTNTRLTVSMPSGSSGTTWEHADSSGAAAPTLLNFLNNSNTRVGYIASSGTATVFSTVSDYRLKEEIAPMTGALAKVSALKPVTYKWKLNGSDGEGFIAHELAEICPHAVTGAKDAVDLDGNPIHQGIDLSFLVATLTAAIQELKAEFDAYKTTHP